MHRALTYLHERFPLHAHGPLVAAFAGGVACASAGLRGADGPGWAVVGVAVALALGAFFQLRVADEWKDAERDRQWQPERPVPRGLVTLRELTVAAVLVGVAQLALAAWLDARLVVALVLLWAWMGLMTAEFFVPHRLEASPLATLLLHGLVVPAIDGVAVAADMLAHDAAVVPAVAWLAGVGYFGGTVVEVGRKVRAPADERPGVVTYSATWGRPRALALWAAAVTLSAACGTGVLLAMDAPGLLVAGVWLAAVAVVGIAASGGDAPGAGRRVEAAAGVWTLALYLTVGPLALWLS